MTTELIGPSPDEMIEGEMYKVVKNGNKLALRKVEESQKGEHFTTVAGPQAEAILKWQNCDKVKWIEDQSVPGCAMVEFWSDE